MFEVMSAEIMSVIYYVRSNVRGVMSVIYYVRSHVRGVMSVIYYVRSYVRRDNVRDLLCSELCPQR